MDIPLQDCTIEEQRGVVRAGVKPVEIHRRIWAQYGQSTVSQRKVYEWAERFKSVTDEGRSGRSSTSRSRKASPQEYRNQLNDITNASCCKGTV